MGDSIYFALGSRHTPEDTRQGRLPQYKRDGFSSRIHCSRYDVVGFNIYSVEVDKEGWAISPFKKVVGLLAGGIHLIVLEPGSREYNRVEKWAGNPNDSEFGSAPFRSILRHGNTNLILSEKQVLDILLENN